MEKDFLKESKERIECSEFRISNEKNNPLIKESKAN